MRINVSYTCEMIKKLIADDLERKMSSGSIDTDDITIQVRSKQNYRDDRWERGELKVELEVDI
jgi:hypothetical protein